MLGLRGFRRAVQKLNDPKRPERRTAPRLAACYQLGSGFTSAGPAGFTPAGIKDISATGIYLRTDAHPEKGEEVTINLWEADDFESMAELQISLPARVTRHGEDGIGLSFVLPPGLNMDLWELLLKNIVILPNQRHAAELFRTLRSVLFLARICPSGSKEAIDLFSGRFNPERTSTLAKIAIGAENLLAKKPDAARMQAHPRLVTDILSQGSWIPDEPTMRLWMGLLANSCSADEPDDSNEVFAQLLGRFTPAQTRIFIHGCERSIRAAAKSGNSFAPRIVLGPREMAKLTEVYDLYRNATDLAYLFNLGLIQDVFDFTSYCPADSFDITPSKLGLELFKRCRGGREEIDPQLVEVANAHLANFLPAPRPADDENAIKASIYTPTEEESLPQLPPPERLRAERAAAREKNAVR